MVAGVDKVMSEQFSIKNWILTEMSDYYFDGSVINLQYIPENVT